VVSANRDFELFNENHVIEKLKLNKVTPEDLRNLVQPNLQQYLKSQFNIMEDENFETQLYCDEAPLSSFDMQNSQPTY
jgi:hypothetical protein